MPDQEKQLGFAHYIEQWGMLFELLGATRMMGRILGWLLICDPPEQTAKEIADAIDVSIGSISTATKTLNQGAMIERIGLPGQRSVYFRIKPGMWTQLLKTRMGRLAAMRELADKGMDLLSPADDDAKLRLREIRDYCAFVEKEFPILLERWEEAWKKGQQS